MENSVLRTSGTHTTEVIDSVTGELLESKTNTTTYLANTKEEFFLMYSSMVLILKGSSDVRMKLFASLLERYSKGQEFGMSKAFKEVIAKETGCKARSFDLAFTNLIKENIIIKLGKSLYKINPRHVFQGSSENRNKSLQAIIELTCPEC